MLVKIVSAPKALGLQGIILNVVFHTGKVVCVSDSEQPILDIQNGNDADIKKLASKARIMVERIPEK